jgi:hypothetical protein
MTTPNPEEQALQAAPTREPEATKTPNTAPRKPRVAPGNGKSGKRATSAKKATNGAKAAKTAKKKSGARRGCKTEKILEPLEAAERRHARRTDESDLLASPQGGTKGGLGRLRLRATHLEKGTRFNERQISVKKPSH